ncbi:MAG: SMC family ATPase, partial [Methanothrix sp.]
MHLNKLAMRNFKKFRRADLDFSDGLTGILGSNGAGKSTIVEAIAWALYGNRASSLKREFIRNSRARESDAVEVALTISLGKQELAIHRAMRGKGMTPEAHLALDGQRIATGAKEVDGKLEEILKISYQDFMKTFYARQKDLDNLLKEGAMGKREYLLKLLGLEDIKEGALDLIKADKAALEEEKSRLAGALTEIGDVSGRLERAALDLQAAEKELEEAERSRAGLAGIEEERRTTLEAFEEKKRRHETLRERRVSLESGVAELKEKAGAEQRRLTGIDLSRKRLQEIQPILERLAGVRQRLEVLEPQRAAFEDSARSIASCRAALEAERRALVESQKRLLELEKDAAQRKALFPREEEFIRLQEKLAALEDLRDKYRDLQSEIKEALA